MTVVYKTVFCFGVILVICVIGAHSCYPQPIGSVELINNAKQFDGMTVKYQGEVIGDIMVRGAHAWLSVNDGPAALGVWTEKGIVSQIRYIGGYRIKGDIVEVVGIFHRSCPEHGGDLDIHAVSLLNIASGRRLPVSIDRRKVQAAMILTCVVVLVFLASRSTFFSKARP
jgi:hypothetical protein